MLSTEPGYYVTETVGDKLYYIQSTSKDGYVSSENKAFAKCYSFDKAVRLRNKLKKKTPNRAFGVEQE